ncbi:MAG: hypothetical protein AB1758_26390, partial [Candidatus Eremiobacterota bacterium]
MTQGTLLAVLGAAPERKDVVGLAGSLGHSLGQPVAVCPCQDPVSGIRTLAGAGARRIVVLPLLLTPAQEETQLDPLLRLASQRWPFLAFHLARPPGWLDWADAVVRTAGSASSVVVAAAASGDPLADSNLARMAHLVACRGQFARVVHGFLGGARPTLGERLRELGEPTVVRWLEDCGPLLRCLQERHRAALE